MPGAVRLGDYSCGHSCWPPRPNDQASPNVFINSIAAHRLGDHWEAHTCPSIPETHDGVASGGSPNVFVNGQAQTRIGDPISCGDTMCDGSDDVIIN